MKRIWMFREEMCNGDREGNMTQALNQAHARPMLFTSYSCYVIGFVFFFFTFSIKMFLKIE